MERTTESKELTEAINRLLDTPKRILIICIEGRAAAGKSTLGRMLAEKYTCNLFHTDDFFLRPEQRSPERFAAPGENIDHERMVPEVLEKIVSGERFSYRPFDCSVMKPADPVDVIPRRLNIIEGSYSMHPKFANYYDLKIFLDIDPKEQSRRIMVRDGEIKHKRFVEEWIPLEEKYLKAFKIKDVCDLTVNIKC